MGIFSDLKKELSAINKQLKEDTKKASGQFKDESKKISTGFKDQSKKISTEFREDIQRNNALLSSEMKENKNDSEEKLSDHFEKTKSNNFSSNFKELKAEHKERIKQYEKELRRPKVKIEIINGDEELGYDAYILEMIQYNSGEVQFKVKKEVQNEVFVFLNFERTENIKKSALDVAGWTFAGNMFFGKAGALAGGLGAQAGKDKSTAALFMVNKETKKKIMLIIKCDSNTLEKLSHFTLSQESFDENKVQPLDKYAQLEKLAKLKEQGILTEDEFTREKEKILND